MADNIVSEHLRFKMVADKRARRRRFWLLFILITACLSFLLVLYGLIIYYNSLVSMQLDVQEAQYQVKNAEQYRENLFPLLAESVIRFTSHEHKIFDHTSDKRAESLNARPGMEEVKKLIKDAEADWGSAFSRIMAWAESYPDLKASDNFQEMMQRMSAGEKVIFDRRVEYNSSVNIYLTALSTFPRNLIGSVFGFEEEPFYKIAGELEWQMPTSESLDKKG